MEVRLRLPDRPEGRGMSRFLTMAEASKHCGGVPSAETLYRLARDGHLPVRRIGRRLVISDRLLDEWIDSTGDVREVGYRGTKLRDGGRGAPSSEKYRDVDESQLADASIQPGHALGPKRNSAIAAS
jgi:predicted DNA-binding transcriptional regulator AlpA